MKKGDVALQVRIYDCIYALHVNPDLCQKYGLEDCLVDTYIMLDSPITGPIAVTASRPKFKDLSPQVQLALKKQLWLKKMKRKLDVN